MSRSIWQKARAALSCGVATGADFATLTVLVQIAGSCVLAATAISSSVGAVANFFIHRHAVYNATGESKRRQMPKYLAVAVSTMILSASLTALLSDFMGIHFLLARALAAVSIFLLWHEPLARRAFATKSDVLPHTSYEKNTKVSSGHAGGQTMSTRPNLSVIIPAYNEQERIVNTLEDIKQTVAQRSDMVEVIVVDDGSIDDTVKVVEEMMPSFSELWLVKSETNCGKGSAVTRGVMASRGEVVLFMDADNSVSLDHADTLLELLNTGADAAIGSRYANPKVTERRQPWYRVAWSRVANFFVQKLLLEGIADTQCGFKAFRAEPARRVFTQLTIPGWGFDLEVLTLLDRMGYSIEEVPVPFVDDRRTKINALTDMWAVVGDFLRVHRNLMLKRYDLTRPSLFPM